MPPHDPHRMHEGELIRIAAGPLTGLVHQPPQREVHEQQAIELLLHEIGPARAQHQALPRQRHLQFGKRTLAFPALVVERRQLRRRRGDRVEQRGDQPVERLRVHDALQA